MFPGVKITVDMSEETQCPTLALKFRVSEVDGYIGNMASHKQAVVGPGQ